MASSGFSCSFPYFAKRVAQSFDPKRLKRPPSSEDTEDARDIRVGDDGGGCDDGGSESEYFLCEFGTRCSGQ